MESICFTILGLFDYHFQSKLQLDVFDLYNMKDMDAERLKKLRDFLKTILEYYKSTNKRKNLMLQQLHMEEKSYHFESRVRLAEFSMLQDMFGTKQCSASAFCLSYINHKKTTNNMKYLKIRLNHSISTYQILLVKMNQDVRSAQRYLERCKEEMIETSSSETDLDSLQVKINLYDRQLKKLESSDSWINDKKWTYDYLNWQIQGLNYLKYEKKEIQRELDRYQGLHPDLFEAAQQIQEMENTLREFFRKLSQYK